jgi:hypothetical protein
MNWSEIGSIGEAVGAIGVIGSLIYLALQVRANSKGLSTSTRESTFNSLKEWNYWVMADPDLAWIFQQGCRDFNSLDQKERARYLHVIYSFYKLFENFYLHHKAKNIPAEVWRYNSTIFYAYAVQPGAKYYYSLRKPIFDPSFCIIVDEMVASEVPAGHSIVEMDLPDLVDKDENET